jgi:hypothetical protein
MLITFHCPCGRTLQIGEEHAGRQGKCPECGAVLDVPLYALVLAEPAGSTPALMAIAVVPGEPASEVAVAPAPSTGSSAELSLWGHITGQPGEPGTPGRAYYKLYSPLAVGSAALLGGVLAGSIVLTYNYQLLGQKRESLWALGGGVLGTAACFAVLLFYPGILSLLAILLVSAALMLCIAHLIQGRAFHQHREKGGEEGSVLGASGLGLLCTGLFVVFWFIGLFPVSGQAHYASVAFGAHGVYYTNGATSAEAQKLGDLMVELGFFNNEGIYRGSKYVWLARSADGYVVSFLLRDGAWDKPEFITACQELRRLISDRLGADVEIWLCDAQRNAKRVVKD